MHDYQLQDEEFTFSSYSDKDIEDIERTLLLEEGIYDFLVKKLSMETSQKGKKMFKVILGVFGKDGQERTVWDFLVFPTDEHQPKARLFLSRKMRNFFASIGKLEAYDLGKIKAQEVEGINGSLEISIKTEEIGEYAGTKKNVVKDYCKPLPQAANSNPFDDDINF